MPEPSILGKRLVAARKRADMTQEQLCRKADVALNTVARLEQGHLKQVRTDSLVRLARALGVTTDDLLGFTAKAKPKGAP